MTSFKFNFTGVSDGSQDKDDEEIEWFGSEEIVPNNQLKDLKNLVSQAKMFICGDVEIGHVLISNMLTFMKENGVKNALDLAEKEHSDLITGKYEGGLKIWECTYDLVDYLEENKETIVFKNKKVLDLGCGAGILGIYALLKGALVTFQDYNKEIIEYCTIPNVLLNMEEEQIDEETKSSKFYSGDWASFDQLLEESEKFDIILTSETLYNVKNYDKLIALFQHRLKDEGIIYIAAKTYYFGVGGGMRQFETAIKDTCFKSQIVWKTSNGIQREILKIKKS
ncbi:histidine protein methyltransferase 1 homolog [Vanessa atalanta]|uniref:histidine protein methyltransferase 1 homolog n=1 Tax=Vanessa atalanta TaxID=42275 RepID=UPI001FCDB609|nr:histidine protein methyltransferase 1 homolog [Vanessa atalanta]